MDERLFRLVDVLDGVFDGDDVFVALSVDVVNGQVDSKLVLPLQGTCEISTVNEKAT